MPCIRTNRQTAQTDSYSGVPTHGFTSASFDPDGNLVAQTQTIGTERNDCLNDPVVHESLRAWAHQLRPASRLLLRVARAALATGERGAKWQLAVELGHLTGLKDEAEQLLREFVVD